MRCQRASALWGRAVANLHRISPRGHYLRRGRRAKSNLALEWLLPISTSDQLRFRFQPIIEITTVVSSSKFIELIGAPIICRHCHEAQHPRTSNQLTSIALWFTETIRRGSSVDLDIATKHKKPMPFQKRDRARRHSPSVNPALPATPSSRVRIMFPAS